MTVYLTAQQILFIHARLVDETGGEHGVRDLGLLESAAALFLGQNGHRLQTTNEEVERFTLLVVAERPSLDEIAAWFRRHAAPELP